MGVGIGVCLKVPHSGVDVGLSVGVALGGSPRLAPELIIQNAITADLQHFIGEVVVVRGVILDKTAFYFNRNRHGASPS